jgi:hypothetical protein
MEKPAARITSMIAHWQPYANQDHGNRNRSCQCARPGSSDRMCSRNSNFPPA